MKASNLYHKIIKKTNSFQSPSIIGKVTKNNFISSNDIKQVFIEMHNNRKVKPSLRVFVNDATRDLYLNLILANPPKVDESLEDWGLRIFADNEYCIIINKAEMWSDTLLRKTLSIFNSILSQFGYNEFDHELMLFIGNYQYTPFGVHIDGEGDNSLQLNIHGKPRKAYLWTPQKYQELTGKKITPFYFPSKIIEQASHSFDLVKNELFILPASKYFHIYSNSGFNISLAYFLKKKPKYDILKSIMISLEDELRTKLTSEINLSDFVNNDDLIKSVKKDLRKNNISLEMSARLDQIKQQRISNLGFTSEPINKKINLSIKKNSLLKTNPPFKIGFSTASEVLSIYLRGKCFEYKRSNEILALIKKLNKGPIRTSELSVRNKSDKQILTDIIQNALNYSVITINTFS